MRKLLLMLLMVLVAVPMALATDIGACQDLAAPDTYTLTNNITVSGTCFTFSSSDVTLDCQGYTLTGDSTGVGIYPVSVNNILVKNCNLIDFDSNYAAALGDNITFSNDMSSQAIYDYNLWSVTNVRISNSTSYETTSGSIVMASSANIYIENYHSDTSYNSNIVGTDLSSYVYLNNVSTNGSGSGVYSQTSAYIYIENSSFKVRVNGLYVLGNEATNITNTEIYVSSPTNDSYIAAIAFGEGTPNLWMANMTFGDWGNGTINYPGIIALPAQGAGTIIYISDLNMSYNKAIVNSTTAPYLNTSAAVTINGLPFVNAIPIVDIDDNGTFTTCSSPTCVKQSYIGGSLIFDVAHFTSYSSEEGGIVTVTLLAPDDASTFVVNPDFIFNFNNTLPISKNCSLWLNKTIPINYMTTSVPPNTDTIYSLNISLSSGNWTWWVNCVDGLGAAGISGIRAFTITPPSIPEQPGTIVAIILGVIGMAAIFAYLGVNIGGEAKEHAALSFMFLMMALLMVVVVFSVGIAILEAAVNGTGFGSVLTLFKTILSLIVWLPVLCFAYFFIILVVSILKMFYKPKKKQSDMFEEID